MVEQIREGHGLRVRGGRGRGVVPEENEQTRQRDLLHLEVEEQRRRIQELERQLAAAKLGVQLEEKEESMEASEEAEEDENLFEILNQAWNQGVRPRVQSFQNFGMKIEIPEFEGKTHPDEFIDWLYTVEKVFDLKDLTKEQKMKHHLLFRSKFSEVAVGAPEIFACVVVEQNSEIFEVLSEVLPLFQEFADIVSEEMPPELPPD